jgi:hypothetical protein
MQPDRFARKIVGFLTQFGSALAAAECQTVSRRLNNAVLPAIF